jgi:hypothetical protein
MSTRRFPPPWQVEQIPGGYKVLWGNILHISALGQAYLEEAPQRLK